MHSAADLMAFINMYFMYSVNKRHYFGYISSAFFFKDLLRSTIKIIPENQKCVSLSVLKMIHVAKSSKVIYLYIPWNWKPSTCLFPTPSYLLVGMLGVS